MVRCTRVCLDTKQYQYSHNLTLVNLRTPIEFAPLDFSSLAPRDLSVYAKYGQHQNV
jgi:hypothetical protein